jgi:elongation factor G
MQKLPLLIEIAIEPKTAADANKLSAALAELTANSMRLERETDSESGQTILRGSSETILEEALGQLKELGVQVDIGTPQVAYREILTRPITIEYAHKKVFGGAGEFALVRITYEPIHDGSAVDAAGIIFVKAERGPIPPEFVAAVEKAVRAQAELGLKAGFPVIAFCATLVRAAYHEVDSSPRTFDIATRTTFRELAKQNVIQIVEPFMKVEVATPEDFLGGVIGDLNSRRARDVGATEDGRIYQLVGAMVPLANMFGYQRTLDSMCQGRAIYEMEFHHYEAVPDPDGDDGTFPGAIGMRVA